jgi:histone deacetylase 6
MEVDPLVQTTTTTRTATTETKLVPVATPFPDTRLSVGYVYSEEMLAHRNLFDYPKKSNASEDEETQNTESNHPETPGRLTSIYQILLTAGLLQRMKRLPIRTVHKNEVMLVHTEDLWDKVEAIQGDTSE